MKRILFVLSMLIGVAYGQTTGFFRYDTVTFEKGGGNSEFKLLNSTRANTNGVLQNINGGRTSFMTIGYAKNATRDSTIFTLGTLRLAVKDSSGGGGSSAKAASGTGLSGDTILLGINPIDRATTINGNGSAFNIKKIDSVHWNSVSTYPQSDSSYGIGASYMYPHPGATNADSAYLNRAVAYYGLPGVNMGFSGAGTLQVNKIYNANIWPGHQGQTFALSVNENDAILADTSTTLNRIKTYNKIINGFKTIYVNAFLKSFTTASSSSVVKGGTWNTTTYNPSTYGGKSTIGATTVTATDSIVFGPFTGERSVIAALIGADSVTVAGARGTGVIRDLTTGTLAVNQTFGTNNQTNGISDGINGANTRSPMVLIYEGLDPTHTYTLKLISNQSTNILAVDYFGHLLDAAFCKPLVWYTPIHFTAAGYATYGGSDLLFDNITTKIDSTASAIIGGRPLYVIHPNTVFNTATMMSGDGVHPNDLGYRTLFNQAIAVLPSTGLVDRTIFNSGGQFYGVVNGQARLLGADFGSGLTYNSGVVTNNLTTGVPGGQTLNFGTNTGDGGTINSNPFNNGDIFFGPNTVYREATKRWGINVPSNTPLTSLHVTNGNVNTSSIVTIDGIASQSGNHIQLRDNSAGVVAFIGPGAFFKGLPYTTTGLGALIGIDLGSGEGELNFLNTGVAYVKGNIRAKGISFQDGSGVGVYGSANAAGTWFMPLTPTITDTTGYYFSVIKGSDGQMSKIRFPFLTGGGGGSQTWQQTLTTGSTLTTNNSVSLGTTILSFNNSNGNQIEMDGGEGITINSVGGDLDLNASGGLTNISGELLLTGAAGAHNGADSMLVIHGVSKLVGYRPIPTRWVARVGSTTSSGTPTINTDNVDIYKLTAQAANITSMTTNLSGTPVDGDILEIQITDNGTARTIAWGASFASSTVTLPSTTVISTTLTVILQFYTTSSYGNNKWICVNSY